MENDKIIAKVCEVSERVERIAQSLNTKAILKFDTFDTTRVGYKNIAITQEELTPDTIEKCEINGFRLQAFVFYCFGRQQKGSVMFELNTAEVIRKELKI